MRSSLPNSPRSHAYHVAPAVPETTNFIESGSFGAPITNPRDRSAGNLACYSEPIACAFPRISPSLVHHVIYPSCARNRKIPTLFTNQRQIWRGTYSCSSASNFTWISASCHLCGSNTPILTDLEIFARLIGEIFACDSEPENPVNPCSSMPNFTLVGARCSSRGARGLSCPFFLTDQGEILYRPNTVLFRTKFHLNRFIALTPIGKNTKFDLGLTK